jgi:hypothetical protein
MIKIIKSSGKIGLVGKKKSSAGALFKSTESLQKPVRQKIHQQ